MFVGGVRLGCCSRCVRVCVVVVGVVLCQCGCVRPVDTVTCMYVDKYVLISCALSVEPTHTYSAANLSCV